MVGEAYDGEAAIEKCRELQPDLVIMDVSFARMNGIQATAEIRNSRRNTCIVIYTMYSNIEYVAEAFQGRHLRLCPERRADLRSDHGLNTVRSGGTYFSTSPRSFFPAICPEAEEEKEAGRDLACLSRREMEIFSPSGRRRIDQGHRRQAVISPKNVETHKYNILEKAESGFGADLTKLAIRNNLIQVIAGPHPRRPSRTTAHALKYPGFPLSAVCDMIG